MTRASPVLPALLLLLTTPVADAQTGHPLEEGEAVETRSHMEQAAFLYGFRMGDLLRQQLPYPAFAAELDADLLIAGFRAALRGDTLPYTDEALLRLSRVIDDTLLVRRLMHEAATSDSARAHLEEVRRSAAAAEAFLLQNAREPGVRVASSGVQYVVLEEGQGPQPARGDVVVVRLVGRLLDGTEFVRTPEGGVPVEIGAFAVEDLNGALVEMRPGERRVLYVPPSLAYGFDGVPDQGEGQPGIPPAAVLIFDVTMVGEGQD